MMLTQAIEWMLIATGVYASLGTLFALFFVIRGAAVIDPAAATAALRTRLIFIPGAVALWPLLLRRCLAARGRPS